MEAHLRRAASHGAVTLSGPAFEARVGRGGRLQCGPSRLQFPKDYQVELFPLHSPLLRESLLVSFPPLSYMLKFSGSSYLISGQRLYGGCAPRRCDTAGARVGTRGRVAWLVRWVSLARLRQFGVRVRQSRGCFEPAACAARALPHRAANPSRAQSVSRSGASHGSIGVALQAPWRVEVDASHGTQIPRAGEGCEGV